MAGAATVYVVDDDTGLRTAYVAALSRLGYQVETANDGVEAQKLVATKGKPAAILLDMLMPNLDGIGFLKQLRSDPANQSIKVVVASNFESIPEANELGVAKYVTKLEKSPEEVAALVDELLKTTS
jgi:CheY-like chemotaxis protein